MPRRSRVAVVTTLSLVCVLAAALAAHPLLASATWALEPSGHPDGLWWAEGGAAQVEIERCEDALCARVVWLRSPFDEHGCPLRDQENPDPALRQRGMIGIELLRDLRPSSDALGEWDGGEIYDPTSGRSYHAVMRMDGADRLLVRGYLGIRLLGRTTTWHRVGGEPVCRERS